MIASEAAPFSKTGGLADVASALPRALGRLGHEVTLFTPRYAGVSAGQWRHDVSAALAGVSLSAGLFEEPIGVGARAMLVECPPLYHRAGLYNGGGVDFDDNALRFAFLVIAALEWAATQTPPIDVVHAHDWQAGLAPAYLRQHFARHSTLGHACRRCSPSTIWPTRASSTRRGCRASDWAGICSPSTASSSGIA